MNIKHVRSNFVLQLYKNINYSKSIKYLILLNILIVGFSNIVFANFFVNQLTSSNYFNREGPVKLTKDSDSQFDTFFYNVKKAAAAAEANKGSDAEQKDFSSVSQSFIRVTNEDLRLYRAQREIQYFNSSFLKAYKFRIGIAVYNTRISPLEEIKVGSHLRANNVVSTSVKPYGLLVSYYAGGDISVGLDFGLTFSSIENKNSYLTNTASTQKHGTYAGFTLDINNGGMSNSVGFSTRYHFVTNPSYSIYGVGRASAELQKITIKSKSMKVQVIPLLLTTYNAPAGTYLVNTPLLLQDKFSLVCQGALPLGFQQTFINDEEGYIRHNLSNSLTSRDLVNPNTDTRVVTVDPLDCNYLTRTNQPRQYVDSELGDMMYDNETNTENAVIGKISIGFGSNIKLSPKVGLFAEAVYNFSRSPQMKTKYRDVAYEGTVPTYTYSEHKFKLKTEIATINLGIIMGL